MTTKTDTKAKKPAKKATKKAATKPRKVGARSLLTDAVRERLMTSLGSGAFQADAAMFAGISKGTYFGWLARGLKERERLESDDREKPNADETPYLELLNAVEIKRMEAKMSALGEIRKAGKRDWRANAWFLEKSYPKEYGAALALTGAEGGAIEVNLNVSVDDLLAKLDEIAKS